MKKVWVNFDSLDEAFGMEPRGGGEWIEYDETELVGTHPYGPLISESLKGRKCTWGDKISKTRKGVSTGRKMSEEHKKAMSEGRWKGHKKKTLEEKREWQKQYEQRKRDLNRRKGR